MLSIIESKIDSSKQSTILDHYELIETATPGTYIIPKFETKHLLYEDSVRTHRLQRDHKRRVKKMRVHFRKKLKSLYHFELIRVTKQLTGIVNGEEIIVEPGLDMGNGHTRREDFLQSITKGEYEHVPEKVSVIVYDVNSFKEYKELYYSFDSTEAAEKSNEKIVGACRALQLKLDSTTAKSGSFGSALDIAYPGDRKDDILTKVAYFHKEIVELDKIGLFNPDDPDLKFQCLIAAGLQALKIHGEPEESKLRIIGGLTTLAKAERDKISYDKDHWYGMDAIIYEYLNPTRSNTWVSNGLHKKTSFMSIKPQMDFLWYCIEMYMTKKRIKKSIKDGMKPKYFDGYYDQVIDTLEAIQPPTGYNVSDSE